MDQADNCQDIKDEERRVDSDLNGRELLDVGLLGVRELIAAADQEKRHRDDDDESERGIREHKKQEIRQRDLVSVVKVEVLRISDRREHTAQVSCDSHDYQREHKLAVLAERCEDQDRERDERYERDVVCEEHAHEKSHYRHKKADPPVGLDLGQELVGEHVKSAGVSQSRNYQHETEEYRQHSEVDVADILLIRRDREARCDREDP